MCGFKTLRTIGNISGGFSRSFHTLKVNSVGVGITDLIAFNSADTHSQNNAILNIFNDSILNTQAGIGTVFKK
ncbi:MAG: hypothetical protein BWX60_00718 [Candidatus Marinimicrobia bacterium ADurb.Bin030]|nr:MAG: hypothetical protein BWX60_00718 [Candidatus Marinimicrobia bacterium ADurb.Bin030]